MKFLRFESDAQARAVFTPWLGSEGGAFPPYIGNVAVDVVGQIKRPTGKMQDTPDGPVQEMVTIPGWHINLSERVPELAQYELEAPATPDRVFAGSDAIQIPRVPAKVTRRQARQALAMEGLLDKVQPAIDAISDLQQRHLAQIEWDDSQDFERDRPLLIQLGHAIGLTDAGIDALFIRAGGL